MSEIDEIYDFFAIPIVLNVLRQVELVIFKLLQGQISQVLFEDSVK